MHVRSAVDSRRLGGWALPLLLAGAACGGSDPDAFGTGGAGGASTSSATTNSVSATNGASTTASAQSSGGTGGAAEGGGGSSDGGGGSTAEGGGGSSSEGGSGGARPEACEGGCVPSADGNADCDEDGESNGVDCQPCDPLVHGGQTEYFDVPYEPFGEGAPSFDYDCSSTTELEYPYVPDGCSAFTAQNCPEEEPLYVGGVDPACGESRTVQACAVTGAVVGVAGTCSPDGAASVIQVRCR